MLNIPGVQPSEPQTPNILSPEEGLQISYPHLFTPQLNKLKTPPEAEYSVILLIPPPALNYAGTQRMLMAAQQAIEEKWPDPRTRPRALRSCFRRMEDHKSVQEKGEWPEGFVPGGYWMTLRSKFKPSVVDENVEPIIDPQKVFGGAFAIVSMQFYAYNTAGNQGVAAGLRNVQILTNKPAQPFGGGRVSPDQEFKRVGGGPGAGSVVSRLLG